MNYFFLKPIQNLRLTLLCTVLLLSFSAQASFWGASYNVGQQVDLEVSSGYADYKWYVTNSQYVSLVSGGDGRNYAYYQAHTVTPPGVVVHIECDIYYYEAGHKIIYNTEYFEFTIVDGGAQPPTPVTYVTMNPLSCTPADGSTNVPLNAIFQFKFSGHLEQNPNSIWWPTLGYGDFPTSFCFDYNSRDNTTTLTVRPLNYIGEPLTMKPNNKYWIRIPGGFLKIVGESKVNDNEIFIYFTTGDSSSPELRELYYYFYDEGIAAVSPPPTGRTYAGDFFIPDQVLYGGKYYDVIAITNKAFAGCQGVTSVIAGDNLLGAGEGAFRGCIGLTEIDMPNLRLGYDGTFYGCTNLKKVIISDMTYNIPKQSFYHCEKLISYDFPDNYINEIGEEAFRGCNSLTEICVPVAVTIGNHAFSDCANLTTIKLEGCSEYKLEQGNNLDLGVQFCYLPNLKDFYYSTSVPPIISNESFRGTDISKATLHVPSDAVETFRKTAPWSDFGSIVSITSDIKEVLNKSHSDPNTPFYNLSGQRVTNVTKGLYIVKGHKVIVK